jgi:PAS domain S-box-containing protein
LRHSRLRSAASVRRALIALIALLSAAGYLVTSETIRSDRRSSASRRAQIESVRTQALLDRARAYVVGLGNILAAEPVAGQRRFAELAGSTAGSAGLIDALWVQSVPASARRSYERRLGAPITRLTASGSSERAPPAASYLPASYTTGTRPELRPGVDVSGWPALDAAIRNPATVFAVTASRRASLGTDSGFYLLESSSFGRGRDSGGYLAVFVPRGWLILSSGDDPREVAISLDGRALGGRLRSGPTGSANFQALARTWQVAVVPGPASRLQSLLPWLALAWPIAAALVAFLVGNAVVRRRRAEREVERIFDLSLDMLCIAGLDGYFKRINPAVERILGYSREQLLTRPFFDFIHPDDVERSREALESLGRGHQVVQFENRYIRSDGSVSLLEWNVRPALDEGVVYAAARDVTDRRLAEDEQAALRRLATLVARGAPPDEVFTAVTDEVARLLPVDFAGLSRYEPDGTLTIVAGSGRAVEHIPIGRRWKLGGENVAAIVLETGRPARIESSADASDPGAVTAFRETGVRSAVGTPIVVEDRLWGVMIAGSTLEHPIPADAEARLARFTELLATAIANAESRAALAASRARIVTAADETRRRIERDLHDRAQQRLVSMGLELRAARATVPPQLGELEEQLSRVAEGLASVFEELREISRGIHPAVLSEDGLGPALRALARRSALPVELDLRTEQRLPEHVEVAAYYVVSEALTNAAKHSHASVVHVELEAPNAVARLAIRDDGIGGADPGKGSGLVGLTDRIEALGGRFQVRSPAGNGTTLLIEIPVEVRSDAGAPEA